MKSGMPCTSIYINEPFEYGYTDDTRYNSNMKRSRKNESKTKTETRTSDSRTRNKAIRY